MFWRQLKPLLAVKGFVFVLGLLSQLLISQLFPILTSHRILECYVQGRQPAAQAAQSHIQPGLECLQGWGIHSLLGQPVPSTQHSLSRRARPHVGAERI